MGKDKPAMTIPEAEGVLRAMKDNLFQEPAYGPFSLTNKESPCAFKLFKERQVEALEIAIRCLRPDREGDLDALISRFKNRKRD